MTIHAKCTLFFESADEEGWSEKFYLGSTDITAAQTSMNTIIPLRAAMLASTMNIIYGRVSDVTIKGDSLPPTITMPTAGTYSATGASLLEANTALNVQLFASATQKNRIFLRGLRSDVVVGREYKAPTGFSTAFSAWSSAMITANVVVQHRTVVGPPPVYTYNTVSAINIIGATARKPGRPFGLPVGRRKRP